MIAEANRMKKEAARIDPNVVPKENTIVTTAPTAPTASKRGRPAKVVADAAE